MKSVDEIITDHNLERQAKFSEACTEPKPMSSGWSYLIGFLSGIITGYYLFH